MADIDPKNNRDTFQGRGARIKELEEQVDQLKQKLLESEQTKGVFCDKCGWSMKFPDEDCRCELEEQVEQLKKKSIESDAMTEDEMAKEIAEMSDEEVKANVDRVFGDDLARRAVACPGWRWMPGMLTSKGRIASVDTTLLKWMSVYNDNTDELESFYDGGPNHALPDLADPATVGCLIHLVREAWPAAPAVTSRHGTYAEGIGHSFLWVCSYCTGERWLQSHGDTEAEALVKALEMKVQND